MPSDVIAQTIDIWGQEPDNCCQVSKTKAYSGPMGKMDDRAIMQEGKQGDQKGGVGLPGKMRREGYLTCTEIRTFEISEIVRFVKLFQCFYFGKAGSTSIACRRNC